MHINRLHPLLRLAALTAFLVAATLPVQTLAVEQETTAFTEPTWLIDFFARESFKSRTSTFENSNDMDAALSLDFNAIDPTDSFSADFSGDLWGDLDGVDDEDAHFSNARGENQVWPDIYSLYIDYHSRSWLRLARLGRQEVTYGQPAIIDGASLSIGTRVFEVFLFGGGSVYYYEPAPQVLEDKLVSGGLVYRPLSGLRFELDYRYLTGKAVESFDEEEAVKVDTEENTIGFKAAYYDLDWLTAGTILRAYNMELSHAAVRLGLMSAANLIGADIKIKSQLIELNEISETENPYYIILGPSLPHVLFNAALWKMFDTTAGRYSLYLGYDGRRLLNGEQETEFNRNYGKAYLLLAADDLLTAGPFLSATFERSESLGSSDFEDVRWAVGASAGYDGDFVRGEVGTAYHRFKYDYYSDPGERVDVQSVFADLTGRFSDGFSARARYEIEYYEYEDHILSVSLTETF